MKFAYTMVIKSILAPMEHPQSSSFSFHLKLCSTILPIKCCHNKTASVPSPITIDVKVPLIYHLILVDLPEKNTAKKVTKLM
jgi:hypothetical protein